MMRSSLCSFVTCFLLVMAGLASTAYANCVQSALAACTTAGVWNYDTGNNTYRFCNGSNWISMKSATTSGTCSTAGVFQYDSGLANYKFCDGTNWIPVASDVTNVTCTSTNAIEYDSSKTALRWCNGTNWVKMHKLDAGTIGTTCADGSLYAGLSPDGNVPMYTFQANNIVGLPWNRGTTTYVDTAMTNCTGSDTSCYTGEANTAYLMTLGTTPSPAPYRAAQYCYCLGKPNTGVCATNPTGSADSLGHDDWYLPASQELRTVYNNLVDQDGDLTPGGPLGSTFGFDTSGVFPGSMPWSSSEIDDRYVRCHRFSDGNSSSHSKGNTSQPLRCIRKD